MKFVGDLLGRHLARYPRMELADIYKLLHQAALGPGHMVTDAAQARARLAAETAQLDAGPDDPLAEAISPDGKLGRVHLRPYLAQGRELDALVAALVETARTYTGSLDKLARFCGCLGDLADARRLPFQRAEVETRMNQLKASGYPVVHHSEAYREAYRPAYRVVDLTLLKELSD